MELVLLIKLILMGAFFTQVLVFGKFISGLSCFQTGTIMNLAMTFSGTLFLSIALIDIIPQAINSFDLYYSEKTSSVASSKSMHQSGNVPLTMIIASVTYLGIMWIDKIMIGHSHDHEYELSLIKQPKKSQRPINEELKEQNVNQINNNGIQLKTIQNNQAKNQQEQLQKESSTERNWRPFILQAGMSIHAFFECLAVGLQKTPLGVLSLASAILVHKWAEGLTLGLIYQKQGFSSRTTFFMILFQATINVLGLLTGTLLIGQGNFIMAFFMSISAGTFLYISTAEVLLEQARSMTKSKVIAMILAMTFISCLIIFEKKQQQNAEENDY